MRASSNPAKLAWLRALQNGAYMMPVIVVFWLDAGLSLTQAFVLQAVFSGVVLLLELPTGYLADRFGRKRALVSAYAVWSAAYALYCMSSNFSSFLLAEILVGVAVSLASGADTALLYDSLADSGDQREFSRRQGGVVAWGQWAEAAAALIGGLLAVVSLKLPFAFYSAQLAAAAFFASTLSEPDRQRFKRPGDHAGNLRSALSHAWRAPGLFANLSLFAAVSVSTYAAVWLYQPYWTGIGLPLACFGALWASANVVVGLVARSAGAMAARWGEKRTFLLASILPGAGMLAMGLWPSAAMAGLGLLIQGARGVNSTLIVARIHDRVGSEMRATVHSLASGAARLLFFCLGPALGWSADRWGVPAALCAAGTVSAAGCLFALAASRRGATAERDEFTRPMELAGGRT